MRKEIGRCDMVISQRNEMEDVISLASSMALPQWRLCSLSSRHIRTVCPGFLSNRELVFSGVSLVWSLASQVCLVGSLASLKFVWSVICLVGDLVKSCLVESV